MMWGVGRGNWGGVADAGASIGYPPAKRLWATSDAFTIAVPVTFRRSPTRHSGLADEYDHRVLAGPPMTESNSNNTDMRRWQCWLAIVALFAIGVGGMLGAFGQLGQDVTLAVVLILAVGGLLQSARRLILFVQSGEGWRLYESWFRRRSWGADVSCAAAQADALTRAVDSAQAAEHDAEHLYGFARCAAEDVIRARAIRVQAEIALLRHRVTELQFSYRR